jgi:phosphohistidine phosphatase
MKYVSLLRHAKSSWDNPQQKDFDRPLNERGRRAAPMIGAYLAGHGPAPDIVLCSSARRTRETLKLLIESLGRPKNTQILDTLYLAGPPSLLAHINALPETFSHVLVIGHNPGLEMLACELADPLRSDVLALRRMAGKFPTGGFARFEFDVEHWKDVAREDGRLAAFVTPRDLEKG